jgi:hypothetical protein
VVVESQAGRAVNASQKSSDPSASSDISGPSDDEGGKDQCVLSLRCGGRQMQLMPAQVVCSGSTCCSCAPASWVHLACGLLLGQLW